MERPFDHVVQMVDHVVREFLSGLPRVARVRVIASRGMTEMERSTLRALCRAQIPPGGTLVADQEELDALATLAQAMLTQQCRRLVAAYRESRD